MVVVVGVGLVTVGKTLPIITVFNNIKVCAVLPSGGENSLNPYRYEWYLQLSLAHTKCALFLQEETSTTRFGSPTTTTATTIITTTFVTPTVVVV